MIKLIILGILLFVPFEESGKITVFDFQKDQSNEYIIEYDPKIPMVYDKGSNAFYSYLITRKEGVTRIYSYEEDIFYDITKIEEGIFRGYDKLGVNYLDIRIADDGTISIQNSITSEITYYQVKKKGKK